MLKPVIILCLAALCNVRAAAQQYLKLHYDCKQPQSTFSTVHVIDNRVQNQLLGYVQKGAFNRQERIEFKGSLADSLANFFRKDDAATGSDKELVLILEDLFMSEKTGAFSEEGKVKLSVRLFVQAADNRYAELLTVDSTFTCSGLDVTQKMLRSVSEDFCTIAASLKDRTAAVNAYTLGELHRIDSMEMLQVPVFVDKPKPGVYKSYKNFRMNEPDIPMEISIEDPGTSKTRVYKVEHTRKGREKKVWLSREPGIYAVSDGAILLRYFEGGWYQIKKTGNGFYFDSPTMFSSNAAMWGGAIGGIAGASIANSIAKGNSKMYRFKINPRTGKAVPVAMVDK